MEESTSFNVVKPYHKLAGRLLLFAFAMGFWLFAWQFERIDFYLNPPIWWIQVKSSYPLFSVAEPLFLTMAELFSFRVLRHFLPLVIGFYLARLAIERYIESFYDLRDQKAARFALSRLMTLNGATRSLGSVNNESPNASVRNDSQLRIGGPGYLYVAPGSAAMTEINGRFARVLPAGGHGLLRFESPRYIIDLRPQERIVDDIIMVTSDGIEVRASIDISFQIERDGQAPSREQQFPFSTDAAKKAAFSETIVEDEQVVTWDGVVPFIAAEELNRLVSQSRLDELINFEQQGIYPHPRLKSELEGRMRARVNHYGVEIREIQLGRFELPDPIVHQTIRYWQIHWERQRQNEVQDDMSPEDANRFLQLAKARLVESVTAELTRMQRQNASMHDRQELALRLLIEMENVAKESENLSLTSSSVPLRLTTLKRRLTNSGSAFPELIES